MSILITQGLDISRLLLDLRRCAEAINGVTGCLDPDRIAHHITDSLIETFDCAFARLWLIETDRRRLRLVASSGLYTRLDGSFAYVPMGHFKIGKIAQHCIPFLSNCLPEEEWVKDREWAIANNLQGFAGLPLMVGDQAIGVLAIFSVRPLNPEFLEVLQMLSLSITGALSCALNHQQLITQHTESPPLNDGQTPLSEQLSDVMGRQKLSLFGTEHPLSLTIHQLLLKLVRYLAECACRYCRLVYEVDSVVLEAMLAAQENGDPLWSDPSLTAIATAAQDLGGSLTIQHNENQTVTIVRLQLPKQLDAAVAAPGEAGNTSLTSSPLSEREHEVMQLLAHGYRDRDIAERLYISTRTVKFHVKNILTKLTVNTRIQAVFEATKSGWLS